MPSSGTNSLLLMGMTAPECDFIIQTPFSYVFDVQSGAHRLGPVIGKRSRLKLDEEVEKNGPAFYCEAIGHIRFEP